MVVWTIVTLHFEENGEFLKVDEARIFQLFDIYYWHYYKNEV
jgi:hypothetical protein